jgi:hypothetical protein
MQCYIRSNRRVKLAECRIGQRLTADLIRITHDVTTAQLRISKLYPFSEFGERLSAVIRRTKYTTDSNYTSNQRYFIIDNQYSYGFPLAQTVLCSDRKREVSR